MSASGQSGFRRYDASIMLETSAFRTGLERLGLGGKQIELHSSFRSLGGVIGGPDGAVAELTRVAKTLIVPTFSWEYSVRNSAADPINRNAAEPQEAHSPDPRTIPPFDPATSTVDADMGVISRSVSRWPGVVRSGHPLVSWCAWGEGAPEIVHEHRWDDAFLPIKRLAERDGLVVLLGVSLTACTAIHLAEEMAGRQSFVRWSPDHQGVVRRARVGGCSDGFDRLLPHLRGVIQEGALGPARVLIAPLHPLLELTSNFIRRNPDITICERRCDRCLAAAAGGPIV